MTPKTIHLCWFSSDPYPVEIRVCLDTWKRLLPDFTIKVWNADMARAIECPFIDEALAARKWAFAADVVRFYAVYSDGGVYMDSDIFLLRRFDELMPDEGFATFNEANKPVFGLQAAFFMGTQGNEFCRRMVEYYRDRHFLKADGTYDTTISPFTMTNVARQLGWQMKDEKQALPELTVYPTRLLAPSNHYPVGTDAIGVHRVWKLAQTQTRAEDRDKAQAYMARCQVCPVQKVRNSTSCMAFLRLSPRFIPAATRTTLATIAS